MGEKRVNKIHWNWQCPYCGKRYDEKMLEEQGYIDHIKNTTVPKKVIWCINCGSQELLDE
ncbi:hypothetical protein ACRTAL_002408 [Clostridium perfringens]|uniref:hypothetical protein n=1 Tax=Clostridium perfringens TaxID=1502 RepID=UPI003BAB253E